jgi:hypothetical protein
MYWQLLQEVVDSLISPPPNSNPAALEANEFVREVHDRMTVLLEP